MSSAGVLKGPFEVAEIVFIWTGLWRLKAARRGEQRGMLTYWKMNGRKKQRACGKKHPFTDYDATPPSHTCIT